MPDETLWNEFKSSQGGPLKVTDFSGKVRVFDLSGFLSVGYTVIAKEHGTKTDCGYEFSAFSYSSPYDALTKLVGKVRSALATRNLHPREFPHLLTNKCIGRVASGGVVVDGEFVTWKNFTKIMQSHEGWEFELQFGDT